MSHITLSLNQFRQIARTPDASARVDLDGSGQALQLAAAPPVTANVGGLQVSVAPKPGHNEASVNAFFKALEQGFGQDIAEKALQGLKGVQVAAGKLQVDSNFDLTVDAVGKTLKSASQMYKGIHGFELPIELDPATDVIQGKPIGDGGYGEVFEMQLYGQPKIYKRFKNDDYWPLGLDPDFAVKGEAKLLRTQEATASFLHEAEKKVLVAPTHFVVSETDAAGARRDFIVEVGDKEFRAWAKHRLSLNSDPSGEQTPGYSLAIIGVIQDRAKGVDLFEYLGEEYDNPGTIAREDVKQIALGLLHAIEVLGKRGFVHGDIKFENAFYDQTAKKLMLIDTGGLSKLSKIESRLTDTAFTPDRGSTSAYRIQDEGTSGLEADLYSVGVLLLELSARCETDVSTRDAEIDKIRALEDLFGKYAKATEGGRYDPGIARNKVWSQLDNHYLKKKTTPLEKAGLRAVAYALDMANDATHANKISDRASYLTVVKKIANMIR